MRRLLCFATLLAATPLAAQRPSRDWAPDERVVIGDFNRITSVAAASDRVFITSPTSLLIWNPLYQRWEGPYDPPEPAMLARVITSLVDPVDNSLWLLRQDGWTHYQPEIRLWDQGPVAGARDFAFDLSDPLGGLLIQTANGWVSVPRGGGIASPARPPVRPLRPASIDEALRANPALAANSAAFMLDGRLRQAKFTAAARSFDRRGWYVGTSGVGLLYLQDGAGIPQRLSFGLAGERVGALFAAPGGIWVANERTADAEPGLTFMVSDLSSFRTLYGPTTPGYPFDRVNQLVGLESSLWAATDRGAVRIDVATGASRVFDQGTGLPDTRALSIIARRGLVTVGTAHGVARLGDSTKAERIAPGFADAASAVNVSGDTTWIGTESGLLAAVDGEAQPFRPRALGAASLQITVVAIQFLADTLVALAPDQLLWRVPNGGWAVGPVLSGTLGRLRAFTIDGDGFWVVGELGVGYVTLNSPVSRSILLGDLPDRPTDVAADADFLWVGTLRGLVRFRLDAIRP